MSEETPTGWRQWVNLSTFGALLLIASLAVSVARVLTIQEQLNDPTKKILRICHWQLELGFREALQAVIDEYEKIHPDVHIIQSPVTEKVYSQWLNTHLVSGTAPDMVEMGWSKLTNDAQYKARFYLPLTQVIDKPNPYNVGTPLETWKWRDTVLDGMRGGFTADLQDYFGIPTSFTSVRLFYNKEILQRATGSSEPPKTLGQLLDVCKKIRELGQREGKSIEPIASSSYNAGIILSRYGVPFTTAFEADLDINLDGLISERETYAGLAQHKLSKDNPRVHALYDCQKRISQEFPPGFMAMGRDQAAFLFVQGRAGFIATGSWDASSLFQQSKFDVGVTEAPLPGPGEPWHEFISGRENEAGSMGAANYGIYKLSRHVDIALDFLQFLTSPKMNELMNEKAEWVPNTLTAKPSPRMAAFMPDPRGFNTSINFSYGNYADTIYKGQYWRFLQNETTYDAFMDDVTEALGNPVYGGDRAWAIEYDQRRRWCRSQERLLSVQTVRLLLEPQSADAHTKFRSALVQQVRANNGKDYAYEFEQVRNQPIGKE